MHGQDNYISIRSYSVQQLKQTGTHKYIYVHACIDAYTKGMQA